jgi:lysosomal acid lipase/cholesteryl ester hydrolase
MDREIPLYTLEGVRDADVTTHYFSTEDKLGLSMLRFNRDPAGDAEDAVLIIHGLTTSTDMFIMPEHTNLVSYLLDNGFPDVWCLDFRMSNRHSYNLFPHRYNFDDVALFDYPPALELIRSHIGARRLHVISHCLGAVTFAMSVFGRAVDGLASVLANSVALTPRVPRWSKVKGRFAPTMIERVLGFPNLNPRWSEDPTLTAGKLFSKGVSLFHRECDVPACHMLSLMWGSGWPALYSHENLADVTHRRGGDLYGATSMNYYRHVFEMVRAGSRPLKYEIGNPKYDALPDDYLVDAREIDTPMLLMTGENNKVFSDSNIVCHERLQQLGSPNKELQIVPGYGHQDVFMGEHCDRDVFPGIVDWLRRNADRPAAAPTAGDRAVLEPALAG